MAAPIQPIDLQNAKQDTDHIAAIATSAALTAIDRLGQSKRTLAGFDAYADGRIAELIDTATESATVALGNLGYLPPVAYSAGLVMSATNQTVMYPASSGVVYAPLFSELPFTTSGLFETSKFRVVQSEFAGISTDGNLAGTAQWVNVPKVKTVLGDPDTTLNAQAQALLDKVEFLRLGAPLNVKWFGAKGDGMTDDSLAIMAGDAAAAALGVRLGFPAGTYRGYGLSAAAGWFADGKALVKNNNRSGTGAFGFMEVSGKVGLVFTDMTFDGWVTDDPAGGWNSGNYNSFQGRIACAVLNCDKIRFERCILQNSFFSPLRVEGSTNCQFTECEMIRGRGNFGDASYVNNSSNINFTRCLGYDFTRIGFVTEAGSKRVTYTDCFAIYGHDASYLYGGGEFNSGCWNENSSEVRHINGTAITTNRYGFVNTTGASAAPTGAVSTYGLMNCFAFGAQTNFLSQSIAGKPVVTTLIGCKSYGANVSFQATANNDTDAYNYMGCHSEIGMPTGSLNNSSFVFSNASAGTGYPLFNYDNCTITHTSFDQAAVDNASGNTADISCLSGGGRARAVFRNVRNTDSTRPVSVKQRTSGALIRYDFSGGCFLYPAASVVCESFITNGCQMADTAGTVVPSSLFSLNGGVVGKGRVSGGAGSEQHFNGVSMKTGSDFYGIVNASDTKKPLIFFRGNTFEKDITANDFIVRIQCDATNKPGIIVQNNTFYNTSTDTAGADKAFIALIRPGHVDSYAGNFSDANVPNLRKIGSPGTGSNPATGNTAITMH